MIDVILDGMGSLDPQRERWPAFQRVKSILECLPEDVREQCSVVMNESTRTALSNKKLQAKPRIMIMGSTSDPHLLTVANALEQLDKDFDLRVADSGSIEEFRTFVTSMKLLEESP